MACNCSTKKTVIRKIGGENVTWVVIESKCEPAEIAEDAPNREEALEHQQRDSGIFGCHITYTVRNIDLNEPVQKEATAFSNGNDHVVFDKPLKPGEVITFETFTDTAGGDCERRKKGEVTLKNADGSGEMTIAAIAICVGVDRD